MAAGVFLSTVVPVLGGLVAIVMYCSPLKAAISARQQQSLGDLNPVPFAVTFVSTACWNAYGFAAPDYNMFLPNIPGLTAALFTSITCHALADRKVQNIMLVILCSSIPILLLLGVMTRFVCTAEQGKLLWGFTSNIITICYYGAPLSSALQVVRQRSSSSIYLPTCIANLGNAALWVAYGFAVHDPFIWVPNGVGGIFALLLISLCWLFPSSTAKTGQPDTTASSPISSPKSAAAPLENKMGLLTNADFCQHLPSTEAAEDADGLIKSYCPSAQPQGSCGIVGMKETPGGFVVVDISGSMGAVTEAASSKPLDGPGMSTSSSVMRSSNAAVVPAAAMLTARTWSTGLDQQ